MGTSERDDQSDMDDDALEAKGVPKARIPGYRLLPRPAIQLMRLKAQLREMEKLKWKLDNESDSNDVAEGTFGIPTARYYCSTTRWKCTQG